MFKFYKNFLIIILFFLQSSYSLGHESVAYINLDYILNNSNSGKSLLSKLNGINDNNIDKLKKKELELKSEEEKLIKEKNILSDDVYNKNLNNLKKKINAFKFEGNETRQRFEELKNKELNNYLLKIQPFLNEFMKKNSINILLDKKNIFIGKAELDITNEIISIINENLK